jgi:UDP-N-acetylmuramoylalanine--D-glutamate ligase
MQYRDRQAHIVGVAGTEGFAILEYLLKLGFRHITCHNVSGGAALKQAFLNAHVALDPQQRTAALQRLLSAPVTLCTGTDYLKNITGADVMFATQNWFAHAVNEPLKRARQSGIPMVFLTQMYFALSPAPIIAVTGTNGKTTVTTCLAHLLKTAGIPSLTSGNDRYHRQVLTILDTLPPEGFLVLEISNRQLMELRQGPHIAILTNIRPDHIDEHGSFEAYRETKIRLFTSTTEHDWCLLNADDPVSSDISGRIQSKCVMYGTALPETPFSAGISDSQCIFRDGTGQTHFLFNTGDVCLPGRHNLLNSLAAATSAHIAGVPAPAIRKGIRSFHGVRHRIEFLGEAAGIVYFDDEASTNPEATRAALESMDRPVVLICGGDIKGNRADYRLLEPVLTGSVTHIIRLPGDAGEMIGDHAAAIPVHWVPDLPGAMILADRLLRPGDALLLSPGGAGFHTRFNSGIRGFRRLVRDRLRRAKQTTRNPGYGTKQT